MLLPTIDDLDREILDKLTQVIARQWGSPHNQEPRACSFTEAVMAYAAVRQLALTKDLIAHLKKIELAILQLNETVLCMLSEAPWEEEENDG